MICPRCFGYMIPESDQYGSYRSCLCCGYVSYPEPAVERELRKRLTAPRFPTYRKA